MSSTSPLTLFISYLLSFLSAEKYEKLFTVCWARADDKFTFFWWVWKSLSLPLALSYYILFYTYFSCIYFVIPSFILKRGEWEWDRDIVIETATLTYIFLLLLRVHCLLRFLYFVQNRKKDENRILFYVTGEFSSNSDVSILSELIKF